MQTETLIFVLSGFLLGGIAVFFITRHALRRHARPHQLDPEYGPSVRGVLRHLNSHATINLVQAEQILSIRGMTAMRYLDQMERDGLIKPHDHPGAGAFYTLP